jgi:hypothetical protein
LLPALLNLCLFLMVKPSEPDLIYNRQLPNERFFTTLPGFPTTTELLGTDFGITARAPMMQFSPIDTPGPINASAAIQLPSQTLIGFLTSGIEGSR